VNHAMTAQLISEAKMPASLRKDLRRRLDAFYQNAADYTAFQAVSDQVLCWEGIEQEIRARAEASADVVKVLEVGAGQSGFAAYLSRQDTRARIHYTAQDVTTQNANWLESQADAVVYEDVCSIPVGAGFDIIFSTFVLEHVTDPTAHLDHIHRLLKPNGSLFIVCPRYDAPGYFCPSSRHLRWPTRLRFGFCWAWARIASFLTRRPSFLIQTDLAAFHQPFFIDADAVHWVSMLDLRFWARSKNAHLEQFTFGSPAPFTKDWLVKRLLTCAVHIRT
jgi:SAM-dependent methyltransferase